VVRGHSVPIDANRWFEALAWRYCEGDASIVLSASLSVVHSVDATDMSSQASAASLPCLRALR